MRETTTLNSADLRCSRGRRREVEYCLEHFELSEGARAGSRSPQMVETAGRRSRRIRLALNELGPVFITFGIYLSSRNDLLPALDCAELASLSNHAKPMPIAEVRDLIDSELRRTFEQVFLYFDPEPSESHVMTQSHAALLPDGSTVTVRLLRPHFRAHFEEELGLLPMLREAFSCPDWPEMNLEKEIAAFANSIRLQTDFIRQAEVLEALALDAKDFESLRVSDVHREVCASAVLTTGRSVGSKLVDVLAHGEPSQATAGYEVARQLCLVWLRQVLLGRAFPVEPRAENVLIFPNNQVAFPCGPFCTPTLEARKGLGEYLNAILAEDPDQACFALLKQVTPEARKTRTEALRSSFRQAVAFRCDEWQSVDRTHGLAQQLLMHWRLMREHGYQLPDHLIAFFRGLFLMTECCHQVTSVRDPLREAAEEVRVMAIVDQFRDIPSLEHWNGELSHYTALMMEMPKRLDEMLTLMADGSPRLHLKIEEQPGPRRRLKAGTTMVILCILLTAISFFNFQQSGAPGPERVIVLAFLLMCMSVLWCLQ
jgi:ubiquinone biosynthesis protein